MAVKEENSLTFFSVFNNYHLITTIFYCSPELYCSKALNVSFYFQFIRWTIRYTIAQKLTVECELKH